MTKILGLTGSIGMGKTTVARQLLLQNRGAVLEDADAMVHRLQSPRGTGFKPITQAFPECIENGQINRQKLGKIVFAHPEKLEQLEAILHPLVREEMQRITLQAIRQRRRLVILEIPLLFEIAAETFCDEVYVVTAPGFLQRARVLKRPGMTEAKFRQILSRQLSDAEKRRRADRIIPTGLGRGSSWREIAKSAEKG